MSDKSIFIIVIIVIAVVIFFVKSTGSVHGRIRPKLPQGGINAAVIGGLYADGSTKTSNAETLFRRDLISHWGYAALPASTRLITPPDEYGKKHAYTPDVILKKKKLIIEFDPHFHHGNSPEKIRHDIDRNIMYARLKYTVVRIRIGGAYALSGNDVIIRHQSFDVARDMPQVMRAIRRAKFYPAKYFLARRNEFDHTFTVRVK